MADTKDQILIDFQAFTGLDDFETCGAILAQHDWNLELAVNSVMHDASPTDIGPARMLTATMGQSSESDTPMEGHHSPIAIDDDASASGPSTSASFPGLPTNLMATRMINFNVEYRNRNIPIVLPDSETVGRIKAMLEAELGIPKDKQELKGLIKRKVDDTTVLRELYLPKDNVLYLLTPQVSGPSNNASSTDRSAASHRTDEYKLKVVFTSGSEYRMYHFNVKGSKKIQEVKQDLDSIINVPVRNQQWSGFPPDVNDETCLCDSGINFPNAEFEVTEKLTTASTQPSRPSRAHRSTVEPAESDSEEDIEVESEDFYDTHEDAVPQSRRHEPLMSPEHTIEVDALEQFTREFAERYGEVHPVFYIGSLDNAIRDALQCRATDRKLLALYLHHDDSIQAHVFCSQLLCSESIVNFLSANFLTWAWDLTHPENMNKLITAATKHFGSIAANQIRSYRTEQLPALLIISRSKATNEVIDAIQGHVTLNELMTRLLHAVDVFTEQKNADIGDERERMAREMIRQEQDMAYQESLEADRRKAEAAKVQGEIDRQERERVMAIEMEEEMKRAEEKAVKEAIEESIARSVPDEPAEGANGNISQLRFRVPGGKQITRRFWAENTVQDLLNFITGQGFHMEEYKVLSTFPRRDITQLDSSQTLEAAKLYPQETLILEEKQ
ncbi:FAS-associated factor 1-like [Littorina saxatilis]|uniref:UBX domain-containing protein n=1 Tax=Littorina saxatilis TaxID=31220 RepID=A0AAN9B8G9_9CAEN